MGARWIERGERAVDLGGIEFVVVAEGFMGRVEGLVARHRWSAPVNGCRVYCFGPFASMDVSKNKHEHE